MSENDVVISGMSGRFPLSDTVDELARNLYDGKDLITEDGSRWPIDIFGMCSRMGKIQTFNRFDSQFFGLMDQMVNYLEPPARMLLEVVYETLCDAGVNPHQMRGSRTGVYVGISQTGLTSGYPEDVQPDLKSNVQAQNFETLANTKNFLASRISFVFDFKGPAMVIDTACSSSLTAFALAINDLRLGHTDSAIVCGTQMVFEPFIYQLHQESGLCSPRGVSAVLDESADGFVKGETIAAVFLQRYPNARRVYATVVAARLNIDGNKTSGMFFPSSEAQEQLMVDTYTSAGVDPLELTYYEAHCTGTKAGDTQEIKAIYNAYCKRPGRTQPLPLGVMKSVMGHAEGGSGIAALIKMLIAYENECISPNLNLTKVKEECLQYCPPIWPVTKCTPYKPGLGGVNNFGIGGVNAHVLVKPNPKRESADGLRVADGMPRLVNVCGRTEEAVQYILNYIESNTERVTQDFLALLAQTMRYTPNLNSSGMLYRGSIIMKNVSKDDEVLKYEFKKQISVVKSKTLQPIWLLFPGLGGQWPAMAKALMPIQVFAMKVDECHQILQEFGVNLKDLLLSDDKTPMSTMTAKFCATTAIEIALYEVIATLDITPDGIIGHSFGEIACAYADGCLTSREAMIVAYFRGAITENDKQIPRGLMAVVGLSYSETTKLCPKGVYIACNNAKDSVVVSGPTKEMLEMIKVLEGKAVFVSQLQSSNIPYHSPYLKTSAQPMIDAIHKYMPTGRLRSRKWVSTSVTGDQQSASDELRYASAEYFVNNLMSPVLFYEQLRQLPADAVIVELGPHSVFGKVVTETLPQSTYISLIRRDCNDTNLDLLLTGLATLYELGYNLAIERLYPRVEWPVPRHTPSIGSLIRWDHKVEYERHIYPERFCRATSGNTNFNIKCTANDELFYLDHRVDGSSLVPGMCYIMLAWRKLAASLGKLWFQLPVIFEDIQLKRAVHLTDNNNNVKLVVKYFPLTSDFSISENDNVCAIGKVRTPGADDICLMAQHLLHQNKPVDNYEYILNNQDIYKEYGINGYDYGPAFQGILKVGTDDFKDYQGLIEWNGNPITYLDSLTQVGLMSSPLRALSIPIIMRCIRIDPQVMFDAIRRNRLDVTDNNSIVSGVDEIVKSVQDENILDILTMDEGKSIDKMLYKSVETDQERFALYPAHMPVYYQNSTKRTVAPGFEVDGVYSAPIPRRVDTGTNLTLDSYEFVANDDGDARDESPATNVQAVRQYIEVCKVMAVRVKQGLGLKQMKCNFNYKNCIEDVIQEWRNSSQETYPLFHTFETLLTKFTNETNIDHNNDKDIQKLVANELQTILTGDDFDMSKDIVNQIVKNERLIRSVVDIVCESHVTNKDMKITEINLVNGGGQVLAATIDSYITHYRIVPFNVDYQLVVRSLESVPDPYRHKSVEWSPTAVDGTNQSDIPIKPSNLFVVRDGEPDIWPQFDLTKLIQDLYDSIIANGFLITILRYKYTEPELALESVSGRPVADLDARLKQWLFVATDTGFRQIATKLDTIGTAVILFRKVIDRPTLPATDNIIKVSGNKLDWFGAIQRQLKKYQESDNQVTDTVWLVASDRSDITGLAGLVNCLCLEPGGDHFRYVYDYDVQDMNKIDFNRPPYSDILANDLAANVIKNGKVGTFRHLKLPHDYDRCPTSAYFLNQAQSHDLSGLQWFDARCLTFPKRQYNIHQKLVDFTRVDVYYSGISFHDVMTATGRIPGGNAQGYTDCILGCEFVGRRADSGHRVMGLAPGRTFATAVNVAIDQITAIPEHWSMADAVTILSTYSTLYYALIKRANLKKGESVLIHSAAGGVGQSAINMCRHYGCDIYVTVGTDEKRQFLQREYGIPADRIMNSRDILFKGKLMELTNGRGVDIVINSLSGNKLDASYRCVADNGRFVELGRYDMVQNKQLGMFDFIRNIQFIGIVIDYQYTGEFCREFFEWVHKNCTNGCVKPYNYTVFEARDADKAFRYMTTGKHIGKVMIKIRDEELLGDLNNNTKYQQQIKFIKPAPSVLATCKTYFDPNKSYIITGGLGGFGMELVPWMVGMGARKFVVTSRSGIKTAYQRFIYNRFKAVSDSIKYFSTNWVVSTADGLTLEGTRNVVREAQKLGPIGGVFHLAIELNDLLMENQSYDKFVASIDTKLKILNNLDQITRQLDYPLDYFVVFSSVAAGKGNVGQTNYAYGNSGCERLCERRRRDGLHALAVQYGPIGDVGVMVTTDQILAMSTLRKQRINSCCDVLDKLLAIQQPVVTSHVKADKQRESGTREKRVVGELWRALGIDPDNTPDHMSLGEIGLESMFAVEFQQELEREGNMRVSLNHVKGITIGMLKAYQKGNVLVIKDYMDAINRARAGLLKHKFIIPTETHTKLNGITTGKPVYFMPTLTLNTETLVDLASHLSRPAIALNWTQSVSQLTSLKLVAKYYVDLLGKLQPRGKYDVVGYLDMAIVCAKLLVTGRADKAVIIDVMGDKAANFTNQPGQVNDEALLEMLIGSMAVEMPAVVRDKINRAIQKEPDIFSRLRVLANELVDFGGKGMVAADAEVIMNVMLGRLRALNEYVLSKRQKFGQSMRLMVGKKWVKRTGRLVLIKPFRFDSTDDPDALIQKSRETYLLPSDEQDGNNNIKIESVDTSASPLDLMATEIMDKIIKALN